MTQADGGAERNEAHGPEPLAANCNLEALNALGWGSGGPG